MRKSKANPRSILVRLVRQSIVVLGLTVISSPLGFTAQRGDDPDWPCQQRLVPMLSAGLFWSGPEIPADADWRREKDVADLVAKVTSRNVTPEQGQAMIQQFVSGLGENRRELVALAFAGLLEETNRQRGEVISQLKSLGRRQRDLAAAAGAIGDRLRTMPNGATAEDAARRTDLEQRRMYAIRSFEAAQQTVRYACEIPVQLEGRLGAYARALEAALS